MAKKYKDDDVYIKESDIDAIRKRPTMYIARIGEHGVQHLCQEIIDNNRDECSKQESPGDKIIIHITDKYISSEDNGRGIPTNLLQIIHETSQAGSNMLRAHGSTVGENGQGTTAYTALSSYLEVTTFRPQEKKKLTLIYKEGILVDKKLETYNGEHHGMFTKFMPSKKTLGTDKIPVEAVTEWLQEFDYTLDPRIKCEYYIRNEKHEVVNRPIFEYLTSRIDEEMWMYQPFIIECENDLNETFMDKTYKRHFKIEIALLYTDIKYKEKDIVHSWANQIITTDGGDHVKSVIDSLSKFITERIVKKNAKYKDEDFSRDIKSHLNVVIKLECDIAHMFSSQAKLAIEQQDLYNAIKDTLYTKLNECNNSQIDDLVECVLINHRMRKAGEQARNIRSNIKMRSWKMPDSYLPCSMIKTTQPKELFIVEGKSARGGVRGARDASFQAIIMMQGKSLMTWYTSVDEIVKNQVWSTIIKVLGCGIGPLKDLRKLIFDKIIINTDADIDGFHIRVIVLVFFLKFYPEFYDEGRIYIAEPPLYKLIKNGKPIYVATQNEYINECINAIGDVKLQFPKCKDQNITADVFVSDAFDYLTRLREISINRSVNAELLEHIANAFSLYGHDVDSFINNVDKWIRSLINIYPELSFDYKHNEVKATINLTDQIVVIDDELIEVLNYIIDIQDRYGLLINYTSEKFKFDKQTTLSNFFIDIEKYYPSIKARFKGLGSTSADVLKEVVTDPKTRRLIRVSKHDVDTMLKMGYLVGKSKEEKNQRKQLISDFDFTINDIDN